MRRVLPAYILAGFTTTILILTPWAVSQLSKIAPACVSPVTAPKQDSETFPPSQKATVPERSTLGSRSLRAGLGDATRLGGKN